ncbi:delta-6 fatty acid desaturase [Mycotypha africana]|uniref:delta-6 fatty acid desaturase n=1 Tax=Mycotypha africana TaxID=64632 RepID=UPI0022FFE92F|nr:delta-6 fatty acid desaturase [Mycotypha africana]KAI8967435.1 delta-6 fatty acid desaturase [Mycotypha africana]
MNHFPIKEEDKRDAGATVPHYFTRAELASIHQDVLDKKPGARKLIVVENKVYDITDFAADHPGGERVILTQEGRDATDVFREMHPPSAYECLANCYVGDCEPKIIDSSIHTEENEKKRKSAAFAEEIRTLRNRLEKEGYFDADVLYYWYKVLSTLVVCVVGLTILKWWGRSSNWAVLASAVIVGLFWQQCGWLAHDYAHYQVIKDPIVNDLFLVTFGNLVQGFSLSWWKNKHNTHHAATNVSGEDPDIDTAPILLWDEFAAANYYGSLKDNASRFDRFIAEHILPHQTRYYFFILAFARLSWAIQSVIYSYRHESISSKPRFITLSERIFLLIHWAFFTYCTVAWTGYRWQSIILFFVVSQITTGYLLALVFAMNHNGMPVLSPEQATRTEFYELQVITGRDVNCSFLGDWIMGGLNYQIEHHVFPEMPRHNLSKIKPMVKQLAKKYDIPYHDTSFIGGTFEVLQTLDFVQKLNYKWVKKIF